MHRDSIRTTLLAAGLCCIPAACACALMIFAAQPLFAFLLRSAATVPTPIAHITVVLLIANLVHMVALSLLQHTGFFRNIARAGFSLAAAMIVATAIALLLKVDIVEFIATYTVVYSGVPSPTQSLLSAARSARLPSARRRERRLKSKPQRTAIAASHTRPHRQSPKNTAAEPKSLMRPISTWRCGVTWSRAFPPRYSGTRWRSAPAAPRSARHTRPGSARQKGRPAAPRQAPPPPGELPPRL